MAQPHYRLQGLTFPQINQAYRDYVLRLGVCSLYIPPVLTAVSLVTHWPNGSPNLNAHGYDQTWHNRISLPWGGSKELRRLAECVAATGGSVILDLVANHTSDQHALGWLHPWLYDEMRDPEGRPLLDAAGNPMVDPRTGRPFCANFFGLASLPKLRIEDPHVFWETQDYILRLAKRYGWTLRADHFDGFKDPRGVVARLRARQIKVMAEQIVGENQAFTTDDTLVGETGIRYADWLNRLFYQERGVRLITEHWVRSVRSDPVLARFPDLSWEPMVRQAKYDAALLHFGKDIQRLLADFRLCGHPEVTPEDVARWVSQLGQYRTYGWPGREPSDADRAVWENVDAPDWFKEGMLEGRWAHFLPVLSGIYAKGTEDRALFQRAPLLGLNEVGGTPWRGWLSVDEFHARVSRFSELHAESGVALDWHDSKWGSLIRAACAVATHFPEEYIATVETLTQICQRHNRDGKIGPRAVRYMIDVMLSAWPCSLERLKEFFGKAFRESGLERSWFPEHDHPEFAEPSEALVAALLADEDFLQALEPMARKMDEGGRKIVLSQQLLGLFIPGSFLFYHGSELPRHAKRLCDPDNRMPIDYAELSHLANLALTGHLTAGEHDLRQISLIQITLAAIQESTTFESAPWTPVDLGDPNLIAVGRGDLMVIVSRDGKPVLKEENLLPFEEGQWLGYVA